MESEPSSFAEKRKTSEFESEGKITKAEKDEITSEKTSDDGSKTLQQTIDTVKKLKEEGNSLFIEDKYEEAITKYKTALKVIAQIQNLNEELRVQLTHLNTNIGVCYTKLEDYKNVIVYCTEALKINPNWCKALHLRGKAYRHENKLELAKQDLMNCQRQIDNFENKQELELVFRLLHQQQLSKQKDDDSLDDQQEQTLHTDSSQNFDDIIINQIVHKMREQQQREILSKYMGSVEPKHYKTAEEIEKEELELAIAESKKEYEKQVIQEIEGKKKQAEIQQFYKEMMEKKKKEEEHKDDESEQNYDPNQEFEIEFDSSEVEFDSDDEAAEEGEEGEEGEEENEVDEQAKACSSEEEGAGQ